VLAAQSQPEAAGFILRAIKGIFVAIGSMLAAIVCALVAAMKAAIRSGGERPLVRFHPDADRRDHHSVEEVDTDMRSGSGAVSSAADAQSPRAMPPRTAADFRSGCGS
jgi:hypothetical protein